MDKVQYCGAFRVSYFVGITQIESGTPLTKALETLEALAVDLGAPQVSAILDNRRKREQERLR